MFLQVRGEEAYAAFWATSVDYRLGAVDNSPSKKVGAAISGLLDARC
jgi:hypothetical protein